MTWLQIISQTWTISEISRLSIIILYLFMITQKKNLPLEEIMPQVCTGAFQSAEQDSSGICNQPFSKRKLSVKSVEVPKSEPKNQHKTLLLVKQNLLLLSCFSSCHFRRLLLSFILKSHRK